MVICQVHKLICTVNVLYWSNVECKTRFHSSIRVACFKTLKSKRHVLFLFEVEQKLVYRSPAYIQSVMAKQSKTGADLTLYTPYTPSLINQDPSPKTGVDPLVGAPCFSDPSIWSAFWTIE